jgi:hypothetical protein
MKNILFITALFFSVHSVAQVEETRKALFEKMPSCDCAIFSNDQYLAVSLKTPAHTGNVRVQALTGSNEISDFRTTDTVVDVKIQNNTLYVLTETTLEAWDLTKKSNLFNYASHPSISKGDSWRAKASGFILKNNFAVISHSVLGISIVDLTNGKFKTLISMPTASSAQDIDTLNKDTAVIAVDNDDEGTFRGIYLMDTNNFSITKQIKIDNAFSSSIRVLNNNRLMLGFFNAIWKFDLNKVVQSSSEPTPERRAWKFPGLFMVDLQGKVFYGDKYFYGCFKTMDENTNAREIKPLVFSMEELYLN